MTSFAEPSLIDLLLYTLQLVYNFPSQHSSKHPLLIFELMDSFVAGWDQSTADQSNRFNNCRWTKVLSNFTTCTLTSCQHQLIFARCPFISKSYQHALGHAFLHLVAKSKSIRWESQRALRKGKVRLHRYTCLWWGASERKLGQSLKPNQKGTRKIKAKGLVGTQPQKRPYHKYLVGSKMSSWAIFILRWED
jgi:hypothetical protein